MTTTDTFKRVVAAQFEAALCMLHECLARCPPEHWDSPIAKYPFWLVAYHTLCYVDCYLAPSNDTWQPRTGADGGFAFHPRGRAELDDEYPSRRFTQQELLAYLALCREILPLALDAESADSLAGPSGFSHLPFTRAELHVYNIRHVQHHTGQLTAFLRRIDVDTRWVKTGWRE